MENEIAELGDVVVEAMRTSNLNNNWHNIFGEKYNAISDVVSEDEVVMLAIAEAYKIGLFYEQNKEAIDYYMNGGEDFPIAAFANGIFANEDENEAEEAITQLCKCRNIDRKDCAIQAFIYFHSINNFVENEWEVLQKEN